MPDKYERDDDRLDQTLRETHETVGRLTALLAVLADQIHDLQSETRPRSQEGRPRWT